MSRAVTEPSRKLAEGDWDKIHERIQQILATMVEPVQRSAPGIRATGGRTSGRVWQLYSYMAFTPQDSDLEAIIAGVTFAISAGQLVVKADIGGEETGRTDYETEEQHTADDFQSALMAGERLATELSAHTDVVVRALAEHRCPPDYRKLSQS